MPSRAELESDIGFLAEALRAADAAGDTERATKYAKAYKAAKRRHTLMVSNPGEYDPESAEFKKKYGAASDSAVENFAAGAGKFLYDRARGVGQIFGAQSDEDIQRARELDAPLMETKAGVAGNIAGGVAATAPLLFIPGANTALGSTIIGGAIGASEPVTGTDSRLLNAGLGAGGGLVGQRIGSHLVGRQSARAASRAAARAESTGGGAGVGVSASGAPQVSARGGGAGFGSVGPDPSAGLSAGQQQAARVGRDLGMRMTPGQATGSRALQQMEAKLSSQPMTSGPFNAIRDQNQRVLNRTWAEAIGEQGDDLSAPVLARAYDRMSDVFEELPTRIGTQEIPTQPAFNLLRNLQDDFRGVTEKQVLENPLVKEVINLARQGQATGRQLRSLTSRLGRKINNEFTTPSGDRELAQALLRAKNFIDDIIEGGLDDADRQLYQMTRDQYRHYTLLTQRVGVINPSDGNIRGVSLANLLQTKDKSGFLRGGNQSSAYNAARFSQAFKDIVGDSGTATRSMVTNPLELAASAPFNLAARAYASGPSTSLIAGANSTANNVAGLLGPAADPRLLAALGINLGAEAGRQ